MSSIKELVSEVQEAGGFIGHVEVKAVTNAAAAAAAVTDYGIFATNEINAGEVLISVPFSQCISSESVVTNEKLKCIFDCEDFAGLVSYPDEVVAM
jgi:hypothetical protein